MPVRRGPDPIFGYIGRLEISQKGLDLLLGGFSLYRKSGGLGLLHIVGSGSDLHELEAMVKRFEINSVVKFLGDRYGAAKEAELANYDVFIHTSRWEGMPLAVLEAAAFGKPLIVSRETNLSTYVQSWNAGYVLNDLSQSAICLALKEAERDFRSSVLLGKAKAATAMAAQEFNWDKIASALVDHVSKMKVTS
jgi:glycosyltransferase involved in cell wall biosynthesis